MPLANWPQEAVKYAGDDSVYVIPIWQKQEERRQYLWQQRGIDPFVTEKFRVYLDFCLKLMGAWGATAQIPDRLLQVEAAINAQLTPDKLNLLISSGILRPAEPPRPHKNAKEHVPECKKKDQQLSAANDEG